MLSVLIMLQTIKSRKIWPGSLASLSFSKPLIPRVPLHTSHRWQMGWGGFEMAGKPRANQTKWWIEKFEECLQSIPIPLWWWLSGTYDYTVTGLRHTKMRWFCTFCFHCSHFVSILQNSLQDYIHIFGWIVCIHAMWHISQFIERKKENTRHYEGPERKSTRINTYEAPTHKSILQS